jgi:hypothetical protein
VKNYASQNNLKYSDALKDPACKASYKTGGGIANMTRYGKPGTFSQDDVARIDKELKERIIKPAVHSVTY